MMRKALGAQVCRHTGQRGSHDVHDVNRTLAGSPQKLSAAMYKSYPTQSGSRHITVYEGVHVYQRGSTASPLTFCMCTNMMLTVASWPCWSVPKPSLTARICQSTQCMSTLSQYLQHIIGICKLTKLLSAQDCAKVRSAMQGCV